jgi:hypothetical protein
MSRGRKPRADWQIARDQSWAYACDWETFSRSVKWPPELLKKIHRYKNGEFGPTEQMVELLQNELLASSVFYKSLIWELCDFQQLGKIDAISHISKIPLPYRQCFSSEMLVHSKFRMRLDRLPNIEESVRETHSRLSAQESLFGIDLLPTFYLESMLVLLHVCVNTGRCDDYINIGNKTIFAIDIFMRDLLAIFDDLGTEKVCKFFNNFKMLLQQDLHEIEYLLKAA